MRLPPSGTSCAGRARTSASTTACRSGGRSIRRSPTSTPGSRARGVAFDGFDELMGSAGRGATFTVGQHCASLELARKLVDQLPLGRRRTMLDVGGGQRGVRDRVLRAQPTLRATLLDFPRWSTSPATYRDEAGVTERIALVPGDAAAARAWPGDQDVVLMSYLLSALVTPTRSTPCSRAARTTACAPAGCWSSTTSCSTTTGRARDRAALWFLQYLAWRPDAWSFTGAELGDRLRGGFPPDARGGRSSPGPRSSCSPGKGRRPMNVAVGVTPWRPVARSCCASPTVAEDLGYSAFTVAEGWGYDAGVLLAEIATRTVADRAGHRGAQRVGAQPGEHRDAGGGPARGVRRPVHARPRRGQPAARRGPARRRVPGPGATARRGGPAGARAARRRADAPSPRRAPAALRLAAPRAGAAAPGRARPGAVRLAGEVADAWCRSCSRGPG